MAMSYSYETQAKVWDRMSALEERASGTKLTTFRDRRPLYNSVLDIVGNTGMLFGDAYRIANAVAGTNHLNEITMEKLETTIPPMQRLCDGTATPHDYARVDKGMIEIYGVSAQLLLGLGDPPAED